MLSSLFGQKSATAVLPYDDVKAVIGSPETLTQDNDFTDDGFRLFRIGFTNHLKSRTFRRLQNDSATFSLGTASHMDTPLKLYASAGLFVTLYHPPARQEERLVMVMRTDIPDVSRCQPQHHVIAALRGTVNRARNELIVDGLRAGVIDKKGQINGLETIPVNTEAARTSLCLMAICARQLEGPNPLDLLHIQRLLVGLTPEQRAHASLIMRPPRPQTP